MRGQIGAGSRVGFLFFDFWGGTSCSWAGRMWRFAPSKNKVLFVVFSLGEISNVLRVRKRQCFFLVKQTIFRLECSCHFAGVLYAGQDSFPSPSSYLFFVFNGPSRSHITFLPLHFEPICHSVTTCCSTTAPTVKT